MAILKITAIGNSVGVILPKELQQKLHVTKGDTVFATEAPGGAILLTPYDPDFAEDMEIARKIMRRDREALRELAK
jgi:putative addiction module antidote